MFPKWAAPDKDACGPLEHVGPFARRRGHVVLSTATAKVNPSIVRRSHERRLEDARR